MLFTISKTNIKNQRRQLYVKFNPKRLRIIILRFEAYISVFFFTFVFNGARHNKHGVGSKLESVDI